MELILWRHAEAEPQGDFPDRDRPLTANGKKQAKKIGALLKRGLPKNTHLFSSPADRCVQTISALDRPFATSEKIGIDASVRDMLELVDWHGESLSNQTVLICSHQPVLGQCISYILTGQPHYWTVKKGSFWWLSSRLRGYDSTAWVRAVVTPDILDSFA